MRVWLLALSFHTLLTGQVPPTLEEARNLYTARRFEETESLCRTQVDSLARSGRANSLETTQFLNVLARTIVLRGRVPDALPIAERSLAIAESLFPADDPRLEDSLEALSFVHRWNGESARSRLLLERIIAIRQKAFGSSDPGILPLLDAVAADLFQMGNYTEAAAMYSRSVAIRESNPGGDPHPYIQAMMGQGVSLWRLGNLQEARKLLERTLALRLSASGEWDVYTAATLHNLSLILGDLGELQSQLEMEKRALRIREKVWGEDHPNVANGLHALGLVQLRLGDRNAARQSLERSLEIRRKMLGDAHREVGQSLVTLGFTYLEDDAARAVDFALESQQIQANWVRANIRGLSEREALLLRSARWGALGIAASALRRPGATEKMVRRVWDAVIRSRSLVLDEMIWRKTLPDQEELAAARTAYSAKLLAGRGKLDSSAYSDQLSKLRARVEAAERELSARNEQFRQANEQEREGLPGVERSLPPAAALVSYFQYVASKASAEESRYGAFVLHAVSHKARFVDLGPATDIDRLINNWREQFALEAASGDRAPKLMERANRTAGLALRRKIWDPLVLSLDGANTVFVAPDGPLHLVNLAALPSGTSRYLVETAPLLHYLNTERDLLRNAPKARGVGDLLIVGDPEFGPAATPGKNVSWSRGTATCFDPAQMNFDALPSSRIEARAILQAWEKAGGEGTLLEGARATQSALNHSSSGTRVVHFATHGFFYHSRCGANADAINPLSLAGLALAGSNRSGTGLLTADKVVQLDLQSAEWAVLSGCDTGLGNTTAGEGLMGLRRAFQLAGARTVIMSLWPVEDASALRWMAALYGKRLVEHLDTAAAVRAASLAMLQEARRRGASTHPLYWTPFVAAGDWR